MRGQPRPIRRRHGRRRPVGVLCQPDAHRGDAGQRGDRLLDGAQEERRHEAARVRDAKHDGDVATLDIDRLQQAHLGETCRHPGGGAAGVDDRVDGLLDPPAQIYR
jgi:hypothetical protein